MGSDVDLRSPDDECPQTDPPVRFTEMVTAPSVASRGGKARQGRCCGSSSPHMTDLTKLAGGEFLFA
jgi:hypothetical protein